MIDIFLRLHARIAQDIQEMKPRNAKAAEALEQQVTRKLGLIPDDLRLIQQAHAELKSQLDAVDAEALAHTSQRVSQKQLPDGAFLTTLEERRKGLIRSVFTNLRVKLPATRWSLMNSFIDGEFRNYLKVGVLNNK